MPDIIKKFPVGFTQVPNWVLTAKDLSMRAKGLYMYLFSKPDGWQFHYSVMEKEIAESKGQILAIIKELVDAGYIVKQQYNENGKFGGMMYGFVDKSPIRIEPHTEKCEYGKTEMHNNNYNNNNNYINNNTDSVCNKPPQFSQPTLRQVIDYAHMMDDTAGMGGFHCTRQMAEEFWSHYTANGWVVSNEHRTPIVDWQAKFRQWVIQEKKNNKDDIPDGPVTLNP